MANVTTINLRRKLVRIHTTRRLKKAISYFKEELARQSKVNPDTISMSKGLNKFLLTQVASGLQPIKITTEKENGILKARLADEPKEQKVSIKTENKEEKKEQVKPAGQKAPATSVPNVPKATAQQSREKIEKQQPAPKSKGDASKAQSP